MQNKTQDRTNNSVNINKKHKKKHLTKLKLNMDPLNEYLDPYEALNEYIRRPASPAFNLAEFMQNMPTISPEEKAEFEAAQERQKNMPYVVLKINGKIRYFSVENTEVAEKINTGNYQSFTKSSTGSVAIFFFFYL
jgi:hypothetical protein